MSRLLIGRVALLLFSISAAEAAQSDPLRAAPSSVRSWLDEDRVVSDAYPWGRYELNVARSFDVLLYIDLVTPACPR